jgi:hypothetical protein
MPKNKVYPRNYKREYELQKRRGDDKNKAIRNKARRKMVKLGLVKKGQDVDHRRALSKGGAATAVSNLRAVSPGKNRSFKRTSSGAIKGP